MLLVCISFVRSVVCSFAILGELKICVRTIIINNENWKQTKDENNIVRDQTAPALALSEWVSQWALRNVRRTVHSFVCLLNSPMQHFSAINDTKSLPLRTSLHRQSPQKADAHTMTAVNVFNLKVSLKIVEQKWAIHTQTHMSTITTTTLVATVAVAAASMAAICVCARLISDYVVCSSLFFTSCVLWYVVQQDIVVLLFARTRRH